MKKKGPSAYDRRKELLTGLLRMIPVEAADSRAMTRMVALVNEDEDAGQVRLILDKEEKMARLDITTSSAIVTMSIDLAATTVIPVANTLAKALPLALCTAMAEVCSDDDEARQIVWDLIRRFVRTTVRDEMRNIRKEPSMQDVDAMVEILLADLPTAMKEKEE